MPCSTLRRVAGLASTVCALASFVALSSACSKTIAASYPGNNVINYPWRSCGMLCDQAFEELQTSHDPTGHDCEELVTRAEGAAGVDDCAAAAALYDSAVVFILRGKSAEAIARFAKAEALDPDPEYKQLQKTHEDAVQRFMPTSPPQPPQPPQAPQALPPAPATPVPTPAPATAPAPAPAPTPGPAPSSMSPLASPQ